MSSFLTNVNRTKIESRHISGKAKLNPISDLQSRFPADCKTEYCSIHKFISETIDSVVDEGAKNCSITNSQVDYSNRQSWSAFAKKSRQRPLKEDRDRSKRRQPVSRSISLSKKRIRSERRRGRRSSSARSRWPWPRSE